MPYKSLRECVNELEKKQHLIRITQEVDPYLEMAEIQRRVYQAQGPAIYFEEVKGSPFPAVCNLFGTFERCEFIFRSTINQVKKVVQLKADPTHLLRTPHKYLSAPFTALRSLPIKRIRKAPVLYKQCSIDQLPQITSWPKDGGPFITLPQVYSENPDQGGVMQSNLGMYRVQLAGNNYQLNREIGLHYQIQRGIGVHHAAAVARGERLSVSIFVGGPPAHTFSAVMPLPEGLSELMFAGMLAGRNFRFVRKNGHLISADADFCIVGHIDPKRTRPEGPFGDHLGYYSLRHEFPVMEVEAVYHRKGAIWPFTVVGRPPQEDTSFGHLIHEITAPMVPVSVAGLHAMHAVDAAGVHPLLLAIGSERYVPYEERSPKEILTIAHAVLGFNQASLAKYLMIVAYEDQPALNINDIPSFFAHLLARIDWRRDLHFQTHSTIDTLDYSGTGLNAGSKVVMAAVGKPIRKLSTEIPERMRLPKHFGSPKMGLPGVLLLEGRAFQQVDIAEDEIQVLADVLADVPGLGEIPLIVVVDDSSFAAANINNFLWVSFTRSNPSHDIYGVKSFIDHKHWGCQGSLIIDARIKPHHAPPLIEDPAITKKVDQLGIKGGPLHGVI